MEETDEGFERFRCRDGARREVLAQIAPRSQEATDAEKTLVLDQVVKLTVSVRKNAI